MSVDGYGNLPGYFSGAVKPALRFTMQFAKRKSCWEWIGPITSRGYGAFYANKKLIYAHRFSFELFIGKIPDGLQIDHLCKNVRCVNPGHLKACTSRENNLRSDSPSARNAKKHSCYKGHRFTKKNTYYTTKGGFRICRTCSIEKWSRLKDAINAKRKTRR